MIAACMKMVNTLQHVSSSDAGNNSQRGDAAVVFEAVDIITRLLAPIVPHICHALWHKVGIGDTQAVIDAPWPLADSAALVRDVIELVVQVNGKLRARVSVSATAAEQQVRDIALADADVQRHVAGKEIKKVIVVPGKLVNIVVAG